MLTNGSKALAICVLLSGCVASEDDANDGVLDSGTDAALTTTIPTGLGPGSYSQVATVINYADGSPRTVCALGFDGRLRCDGDNTYGELGNGTTVSTAAPGILSQLGDKWSAVAARSHVCGIKSDQTLWCWGDNANGGLGIGSTLSQSVPRQVDTRFWQAVTVGYRHTCGISDGQLFCWGNNATGQLGIGDRTDAVRPQRVQGYTYDWKQVSAGNGVTCGIRGNWADDAGDLYCWGQLGYGTKSATALSPQLIKHPLSLAKGYDAAFFRSVSVGNGFICAVDSRGEVLCSGADDYEQLGNGSGNATGQIGLVMSPLAPRDRHLWTDESSIQWVAVSAGFRNACGLRSDGSSFCWGGAARVAAPSFRDYNVTSADFGAVVVRDGAVQVRNAYDAFSPYTW